eukprot:GHVT01105139.1.p1 GENE.GHVT01105139.1~~GHVT01105139.1.p1  ORF type:complete len:123 (+),score=3.57 GHVT01105139.1:588-956(+)
MLEGHNKWRKPVDLAPLIYDSRLEQNLQEFLKHQKRSCELEHSEKADYRDKLKKHGKVYENIGENIAKTLGFEAWKATLKLWIDNEKECLWYYITAAFTVKYVWDAFYLGTISGNILADQYL